MKIVTISVFFVAFFVATLAINFNNKRSNNLSKVDSTSQEKCPEPKPLPEPFELNQFIGNWYEIERTNVTFEEGQRCVQANYQFDQINGIVLVYNFAVDKNDDPVYSVGAGETTDKDNVFAVKFDPLAPYAQYWVVDTDYSGYALIVSCNDVSGLGNDAWILSRQSTLDSGTISKLKSVYEDFGFDSSQFAETPQNC